ncbi:MAG: discoidin domain-containing protein [Chloroflexi bacterium]|nr:discoidin domain-containing protein [Chloroflexota bacterium]MBU1747760.1 discoidin domain-containing protein [Chloroflexota bacterium]
MVRIRLTRAAIPISSLLLLAACVWGAASPASPQPTAPPAPSRNLALGRPAVASSSEPADARPGNAVDGQADTAWSSQASNPQWLYVDLGAPMQIERVVLKWDAAYGRTYHLQVADDTNPWSWDDVYRTTEGAGGVEDLALPYQAVGRYVRLYGLQRGTAGGYALREFEVYGQEYRPDPATTPWPTAGIPIRGYVRLGDTNGPGLADVQIYARGGYGSTSGPERSLGTTGPDGYYWYGNAIPGMIVWAQLEGYVFEPKEQEYYREGLGPADFYNFVARPASP